MKRSALILSSLLAILPAVAQDGPVPKLEGGVYALKMSPNGKWIGSQAGDASIYNVETGENIYYSPCSLGVGNAMADNGMAVGCANDVPTIMYKGNTIYPDNLMKYWFCDINGITPDATHIVGIVNNTKRDGVSYVPFIAPVDGNGNVGEVTILPYPDKDFFGVAPQYCTAVTVNRDATVIVGQVQDWRGMYSYPIYYKKKADGTWEYTCPSESMFNPTGIELPQNPWVNEPAYPDPENFMSGSAKDAYLAAFEAYTGGAGAYPEPSEYMTEEEYEAYADAVESYNKWYYQQEQTIREYQKIYSDVQKTSPSFAGNDMAMHPSGEYFMMHGGKNDENGEMMGTIYCFSTINDEVSEVKAPGPEYFPIQILSDNTLIVTKPIESVPTSYIRLPGQNEFLTIQEYYKSKNVPSVANWLDTTVPGGTGFVLFSDDMKFMTGALIPDQLADYDESSYYYSTYFLTYDTAGVESLTVEPADGVYRVYNLQGVKVMETKNASELDALHKGIYIINGKKILK